VGDFSIAACASGGRVDESSKREHLARRILDIAER